MRRAARTASREAAPGRHPFVGRHREEHGAPRRKAPVRSEPSSLLSGQKRVAWIEAVRFVTVRRDAGGVRGQVPGRCRAIGAARSGLGGGGGRCASGARLGAPEMVVDRRCGTWAYGDRGRSFRQSAPVELASFRADRPGVEVEGVSRDSGIVSNCQRGGLASNRMVVGPGGDGGGIDTMPCLLSSGIGGASVTQMIGYDRVADRQERGNGGGMSRRGATARRRGKRARRKNGTRGRDRTR